MGFILSTGVGSANLNVKEELPDGELVACPLALSRWAPRWPGVPMDLFFLVILLLVRDFSLLFRLRQCLLRLLVEEVVGLLLVLIFFPRREFFVCRVLLPLSLRNFRDIPFKIPLVLGAVGVSALLLGSDP